MFSLEKIDFVLFSSGEYSLSSLAVLAFVLAVVLTYVVSRLMRKGLTRWASNENGMTNAHVYTLGRIMHYLVLLVGLLFAISFLGFDFGKLAIVAGALGIGIGLGLQNIVNNFVSGLVILFEKSLKVGDFIEINEELVGEVIEINMRATLIRTNDNVDILVPNSELIGGMVTNWTLEENIRRFRISFSVAYGSDKEKVRKAILEAAHAVPYTLNAKGREPQVWMTGFGDSALHFVLGVWVSPQQVKRPTALTSDYLWAIDDSLRQYAIEIPFPQRDLHIRSDARQQAVEN